MAETTHKPSYILMTDPVTGKSVLKLIKHNSSTSGSQGGATGSTTSTTADPSSFHSAYDYLKYFAFDYTPIYAIAGGMIAFLAVCYIVKKAFRLLTGKSDSYYTVTTYKIKR